MGMKFNIRTKLLLAFAVVVVMTAVVGYIGVDSANNINNMLNTLYLNQTQSISYIKEVGIVMQEMRVALTRSVLFDDPAEIQGELDKIVVYEK
jgi:sensor histidine kinase regulating citrate/malate metabolism